jgi:hypothetical protein
MDVPRGTEDMQLCDWRTAGGNEAGSGSRGEADVLRLEIGACGDRSGKANARRGRVYGLMAEMADGAGVRRRRRFNVMVPDHAERRPQHQRKQRHGEYETPDSLAVGHVLGRVEDCAAVM